MAEPHSWCSVNMSITRGRATAARYHLSALPFFPFPWGLNPEKGLHSVLNGNGDRNTGTMKSCCSRRTRTGTEKRDWTGHSAWSSVISSDIHVLDGWIFPTVYRNWFHILFRYSSIVEKICLIDTCVTVSLWCYALCDCVNFTNFAFLD